LICTLGIAPLWRFKRQFASALFIGKVARLDTAPGALVRIALEAWRGHDTDLIGAA